jgi:hypothetical protein
MLSDSAGSIVQPLKPRSKSAFHHALDTARIDHAAVPVVERFFLGV